MLLQNNNSKNLIKIGLCEIGSYLYINKPIVLDWSDCEGSMGRFCSLLNEENEVKNTLQEELNSFLYNDYTDNLLNLYNDFRPLFNVLENGKYFINFQSGGGNKPIDFTFSEFPKNSNYNQSELLNETEKDVLHFTANWYFDFKIVPIIASQLKSNIDYERIEFYKKEISAGK